jgi:hypothetical protein
VANHRLVIIGATLLQSTFAQALHYDIRISNQLHDSVEGCPMLREETVEVSNLICCSRVTIEEKPSRAVFLLETIGNQIIGEGIRDVVARIHERLGFQAQGSLILDVVTENVTRGDGGDCERLGQLCRLRSLSCAWGSDQK